MAACDHDRPRTWFDICARLSRDVPWRAELQKLPVLSSQLGSALRHFPNESGRKLSAS